MKDDRKRGVPTSEGGSLRDPSYDYGDDVKEAQGSSEDVEITASPFPSMPIDPVVRQALITKGILTPADLREAEESIRMLSGVFNGNA